MSTEVRTQSEPDAPKPEWRAYDGRNLKAPADCVDYAVVDEARGIEVARVWTLEDARKIAALPDLLEALKNLVATYDNSRRAMPGLDDEYVETLPMVKDARAAIAKAEGK